MRQLEFMQVVAAAMAAFVSELSTALNLQAPFTADRLCAAVAGWRDVHIDVLPHRMGAARIYGFCKCVRERHYVIFYRCDGTTAIQQQRIIFHELCHIILGHVSPLSPLHALRDPLTVTLQDQEAELFAALTMRAALALGAKLTVEKGSTTGARRAGRLGRLLVEDGPLLAGDPADQFDAFVQSMGGRI